MTTMILADRAREIKNRIDTLRTSLFERLPLTDWLDDVQLRKLRQDWQQALHQRIDEIYNDATIHHTMTIKEALDAYDEMELEISLA